MNTTELRLFTDWLAEHLGKHEDQMLTNELLDGLLEVARHNRFNHPPQGTEPPEVTA